MPGVLGDGSTLGMGTQHGILGYGAPSIMIRQIGVPMGAPQAPGGYGFGFGGGGGEPEYGSDEWALKYGGPGAMLWREIMRGLNGKNPMDIFGGKGFSDTTRGYVSPEFRGKKG